MTFLCPITTEDKQCRILEDYEFISQMGIYNPKPVSVSDVMKLIDVSDLIFYNEDSLLRGRVKTLVLNLGVGGGLTRLNASNIDDASMHKILRELNCK